MGYTLTINTTVKCTERFDEVAQYTQTEWVELNKTNPGWWELTVNAEECKLKWYSDSYKVYDILEPILEKMYQHFADIVFIDELIADNQPWGTYLIEGGKSTQIHKKVLALTLKTGEDSAKISEYLATGKNEAFCREYGIEHKLDYSSHEPVWIYPTTAEETIKEYAKKIIADCPDVKCYFSLHDYENIYWEVTHICRQNGAGYIWKPVPEEITKYWEDFLVSEDEEGE